MILHHGFLVTTRQEYKADKWKILQDDKLNGSTAEL